MPVGGAYVLNYADRQAVRRAARLLLRILAGGVAPATAFVRVPALVPESRLMVDAGASDAFWPHGLKWALTTARMLADHGVDWFEQPLRPDALDDFVVLRRQAPVRRARGAGPLDAAARTTCRAPFLRGTTCRG